MLGRLEGALVVDLFAGSGALGIEALSRGAGHVTFVERDQKAVAAIRGNLERVGYGERASVARADVARWLARQPEEAAAADVVLADPPYNDAVLDRALELLDGSVKEGALVVVEHSSRQTPGGVRRLRSLRERRYGDTAVTLLEAGPR
jgi:16S rRNA (guanine966-N2)-methyltransferase